MTAKKTDSGSAKFTEVGAFRDLCSGETEAGDQGPGIYAAEPGD